MDIEGYPIPRKEKPSWMEHADLLPAVLPKLSVQRQQLINALFFQGMSVRAYARSRRVHHSSVEEQLRRTLVTLRRLIDDERSARSSDAQD